MAASDEGRWRPKGSGSLFSRQPTTKDGGGLRAAAGFSRQPMTKDGGGHRAAADFMTNNAVNDMNFRHNVLVT